MAVIDHSHIAEEGKVSEVFTNPRSEIARNLIIPKERTILETEGGEAYPGRSGDCLTWEYHVRCSEEITSVAIGGLSSTMEAVSVPTPLPLIGDAPTWHVFAIRGLHKPGAANNLRLQVNYCYSYGG